MKTCFTCGEKMTPRDTYIEHDEYVGIITIPNVKYFVCRRCGEESVSGEILQKIDEEYKRLLSELLWKRLGSIDAINHQYMTNRELVEKLGISRQAIAKNFLIKGRIFNIVLFGQRYYLRESVELFLRTGDGRFPLVDRVNDNSNKYADSNASSFSRHGGHG
ncbi:MAG: YgiT-type zinc finger protein [Lentisphaerae bacterium]|jgi:YgiT-type zinc finger domain-containing protein|nr:YgiT-type zinc finger protein [Lentisphaerota bacterium]